MGHYRGKAAFDSLTHIKSPDCRLRMRPWTSVSLPCDVEMPA